MHRFLVPTETLAQDNPELPEDALHHLKVLRLKSGEEVELFDGHGSSRRYELITPIQHSSFFILHPLSSTSISTSTSTSTFTSLTLFACITKGSRWDWTIEKATELGVTRIVPVISERTIVRIDPADREKKRQRYQRIAEDASRQSGSLYVPEIVAPLSFKDALPLVRETVCFIGALTTPPSPQISQSVNRLIGQSVNRSISLFIGPEGDFTPAELESLMEIANPVSFGSTILRAETAAIYGLSVIKSYLDVQSR